MVRRIFAIVLIVLGLGTIGAAIASGTIWRPDDRVTLTLPATPDVPLVITAPGVLNAVDDDVDVRIVGASAESPIVMAMARESDVRAWIGDAPYWEVSGLTDWETLSYTDSRDAATEEPTEDPSAGETEATDEATDEVTEDPTDEATESETPADEETPADTVPNPSGSDLWVEELTGTGELEYSWTAIPGRWVMLVATDGTEPAPRIELTWDREVETPFVQPGVILGSVFFVLGLGLLILQLLTDAEKRRSRRAAAAAAAAPAEAPVAITPEGDRPLTRREIRLAEEARRRGSRPEKRSGSGEGETETIPVVPAEAATSAESPAEPATPAEGPESADDRAGELDAWVRGGAVSPLLHEGERTTPAGLELPEEPATDHGDNTTEEAAPSGVETSSREPWWRRRAGRKDVPSTAAGAEQAPDPTEPVVEPDGQTEAVDPSPTAASGPEEEENGPQEWGASWRQTWGMGSDAETEPKEGDR
ncbi:hypothetical protein [Pseudactinotalea sp.]|uniref:hypothetical protein n=1 Tax=Pseudactinotalea sp. TaxID=1926260 RepID=UPI003B3B3D45